MHTTGIHVNVIYTNWHGRSTDFTLRMICKAGLKRSYSYENLPVQTKNGNFVKETDTCGYSVV